ncbi:MAG: CoA transferase [Porticoccaceae bacterium]
MLSGQPLRDIRVVELGQNLAAPFGALVLAELGARVLKVEAPSGDDARHYGARVGDRSSIAFESVNRGKASITLDLGREGDRDWLREHIAGDTDVCIQSLRPGRARELGLGSEDLLARNPRLLYCNVGAFGAQGPLASQPGYDPMMQAFSGIMSVTGEYDRPPSRVGVPLVDWGTGMWLALAVLVALRERDRSGRGGLVDVSLLETALSFMSLNIAACRVTGKDPRRAGSGLRGVAPNRAYRTADGPIMVSALNDRLFARLAQVLGHPEWMQEPDFATATARGQHQDRVDALLEGRFATRSRAEWLSLLEQAGVPCAPIHSASEALAHPQVQALGMVEEGGAGAMPRVRLPLSFDGVRPAAGAPAPGLGAYDKTREQVPRPFSRPMAED